MNLGIVVFGSWVLLVDGRGVWHSGITSWAAFFLRTISALVFVLLIFSSGLRQSVGLSFLLHFFFAYMK